MLSENERADALMRRLERERKARREAEEIAERVTAELFATIGKLEQANSDLESANESIREFVAVASHDIRGPLTVILGAAQLLQDPRDLLSSEQVSEFLETIEDRGRMLERLVEDLLCVSQLELGVVETKVSEISLRMQLDHIVHDLQADTVLIRTLTSNDLVVRADPDHVQRILMNYLSNALKYGEPPVEIELGEVPSFAEVRVKDRGPGVPDEFVHRLFTKFARADSAMTGGRSGTGLGLSIVRGLAQANGGDAWYEPVLPHGACFGLRLPLSASV